MVVPASDLTALTLWMKGRRMLTPGLATLEKRPPDSMIQFSPLGTTVKS